ncbi:hypothetical protein GQX73_g9171 [Xylaria multiplex]|uniref:Uncharacterized protein n=1 Tax=Xylaria multiplex TaxID=323545 RepID=A0A7C8MJV6_9PEZI|nr:hypothetical protein GQX73_g9171 [Xylaria multiplex]
MRLAAIFGSVFIYKAACPATVVIETPFETPSCTPTPPAQPAPCETLPDCSESGLDIDYYANPVGYYGTGNVPPSYYISQGLSPLNSSLTNITFFSQDTVPENGPVGWTRVVNGGIPVNGNNFTLVYSGFYRAPSTGVFTVCSSSDNENAIFFGRGNAFSCDNGKPSTDAQPLVISRGESLVNPINCTDLYLV